MDKNKFAITPPMGWNSYDYYDTTVNEEQVRANALYMAENLKEYGWEYIIVDIEWYSYDAGSQREKYQYIPFWKVEMDEYSRLLPCVQRFPSAKDGKGFAPLADYVHGLGLKFGIHIMRGIPRNAAHAHTKILGTSVNANDIADPSNICRWNPDMYGIRPDVEGAQEYYDSLMALYAQWGVDFIKCDDICNMYMPTAKQEIVMLHKAIQKCGRPIVLSLSPGPALIEEAWHYESYANMWRVTDDFWDRWELLLPMFERCELWQNHVSQGCYPDCDMLPLGKVGKGFGYERECNFTPEEQITMMTLWCIFRSPMMIGAELTKLDDWTKSLLTNKEVLHLLKYSEGAKQIERDDCHVIWCSKEAGKPEEVHSMWTQSISDAKEKAGYIAVFNLEETPKDVMIPWQKIEAYGITSRRGKELWSGEETDLSGVDSVLVPRHGARLFKLVH